jgi:hypothetical protein
MRTSITALLLLVAGLTGASSALAQTPPPQPPPAAPGGAPPPPPPAGAPAPPPATVVVVQPAPAPAPSPTVVVVPATGATGATGAPGAPGATGAPGAPAAPVPMWYDKFSADAFVDAYASLNYNTPKPQGPTLVGGALVGGNGLRAFDVSNGFSIGWAGVNASYSADPIGGTVGLRFGPNATLYHVGTSDAALGLQYVKQAYATWKPLDKLTLDFGKWDQPYGSEVADSQLNMNYTRSVLFWFLQPIWYTGLRVDYAPSDMVDMKVFAANGWNNSIDNNAGKTFGAQLMLKPADQAIFYLGYVGGPEQPDPAIGTITVGTPPMTMPALVPPPPGTPSNWRHMIDFVADINPTKELRFLFNFDYRTESNMPDVGATTTHTESVVGGNLVIRYAFTDAFYASLRGEYYHDEHTDTVPTKNVEDGTLTLAYGVGNHLALMLDNRLDIADDSIFATTSTTSKTQFTTTLGVIASTK